MPYTPKWEQQERERERERESSIRCISEMKNGQHLQNSINDMYTYDFISPKQHLIIFKKF
jgi:hypothetical protein